MTIDAIKETILEEARERGRILVANAERAARRQGHEAEGLSGGRLQEARDLGEAKAAAEQERSVSVAELQGRDRLLAAKREYLAEALEAARTMVDEWSEDEYVAALVTLITKKAPDGSRIVFDTDLPDRIRERVISQVNQRLLAQGSSVDLADTSRPIGRGFIALRDHIEEDWSFARRLEALADEDEAELSSMLFRDD